MKTKCAVITVIAVLGLAATLFAAEQQKADVDTVITSKSHGIAFAELRLLKGAHPIEMHGQGHFNEASRIMTFTGGVTVQIAGTGGSAVTIKADEFQWTQPEK